MVRVTSATKRPDEGALARLKGPLQSEIDAITADMAVSTKVALPIVNIEELVLQSDVNILRTNNIVGGPPRLQQIINVSLGPI